MNNHRKIKLQLYQEHPYCYWCNQKVILTDIPQMKKGDPIDPRMATIDHLISRFDLRRYVRGEPNERRKVLACFKCNQERCIKEAQQLSPEEYKLRCTGFSFRVLAKKLDIPLPVKSIDILVEKFKEQGINIDIKSGQLMLYNVS